MATDGFELIRAERKEFMKGFKNFAVTFAVSALVIGIVAVFVTGALKDTLLGVFDRNTDELTGILNSATGEQNSASGSNSSTNTLAALEGKSFTMLLVCSDYRPNVYKYANDADDIDEKNKDVGFLEEDFKVTGVRNICLVTCSKEQGEFAFTPIPPNMSVSTPSGTETLYNVYGYYGMDFFKNKIESVTGLEIDYWAAVNCTDISSIIDRLGAVFCNVPCEIFTDGKEYISATGVSRAKAVNPKSEYKRFLEKCDDYIGPSCMGMLLFRDYSDGIDDELTITESFTKGVFTNFAKLSPNGCVSMWRNIQRYTESNIGEEFFVENAALISAYSDSVSVTVSYPGLFKAATEPENARFEPNVQAAVEALSKYR